MGGLVDAAGAHRGQSLKPLGAPHTALAHADVTYTPQLDGSLSGTMHTDILSGACQGTVEMHMTAERV